VAVGLNYTDHAKELGMAVPGNPILFIKPSGSVLGPGGEIVYPASVNRLDYEAELAFVIRKTCRNIRASEADGYILGYTCFNDVTARDQQKEDIQWTRAKGYDTFSPFGPWIVTPDGLDPDNLRVQALLNGRIVQDSSTSRFIFKTRALLEFISGIMTLFPGDVVTTGTPPGVGPMKRGDTVTIRVEKIGDLTNTVR
jgi:2-keto-4-pentenoate hydratase/2-oxohepta-3-ene-1,7-dioic acid hydratase in catechol pathway